MGYKIVTVKLELPNSDEFSKKTIVKRTSQLDFIEIVKDIEGEVSALFFEDQSINDDTQYIFTCYREFVASSLGGEEIEQKKSEYISSFCIDDFNSEEGSFLVWNHFYMCKDTCGSDMNG